MKVHTSPQPPPKRRRLFLRRTGLACAAGLLVVIALATALVTSPRLLIPLAQRAATAADIALHIDHIALSLTPPRLTVLRAKASAPGMTISLPKGTVTFAPGGIFGPGPVLSRIEIDRPLLVLAAGKGPDTAAQDAHTAPTPTPLPILAEHLSIHDGQLRITSPQGNALLRHLSVTAARDGQAMRWISDATLSFAREKHGSATATATLRSSGSILPDGAVDGLVTMPNIHFTSSKLTGDAAFTAQVLWDAATLHVRSVELTARSLILPERQRLIPISSVDVRGTGALLTADDTLRVQSLSITVDNVLHTEGSGTLTPKGVQALDLRGIIPETKRLAPFFGMLLPQGARPQLDGAVHFTCALDRPPGDTGTAPVRAAITTDGLSVTWPQGPTRLDWSGTMGATFLLPPDSLEEINLDGKMHLGLRYAAVDADAPFSLAEAQAGIALSGTPLAPVASIHDLRIPKDALRVAGSPLPFGPITAQAIVRQENNAVTIDSFSAATAPLGRITGSAAIPLDTPNRFSLRLRAPDATLSGALGFFRAFDMLPQVMPPATGAADIALMLDHTPRGPRYRLNADLRDIAMASQDDSLLVDGMHLQLAAESAGQELRGTVVCESGELLYTTLYMNFADMPFVLDAACQRPSADRLRNLNGTLTVGSAATFALTQGRVDALRTSPRLAGATRIDIAALGPLFSRFIREPLAPIVPSIADATLTGRASLRADIAASRAGFAATGTLRVPTLTATAPQLEIAATDLSLTLPFSIAEGRPPRRFPVPADWGRLTARTLALPTGTTPDIGLRVRLEPNHCRTRGDLPLSLYGGTLTLRGILVDAPFSPAATLRCTGRVDGVDLAALDTGVPLEGSISGSLGHIVLNEDALTTTGTLGVAFFGGTGDIRGIGMRHPFSGARVAGVDAITISDIDLEPLSAALEVGRITGRLNLTAQGVLVAYGQPVGMDLTLRSTNAPGVSKRVSLKAVNTISVIGTGQGLAGIGAGAFASMFKEFGYDSIGIHCHLDDDIFSVRGLLREGGIEYLIKKPLLFGINVINRTPQNRIAFSDMMQRIQRVTTTSPQSGKEAP